MRLSKFLELRDFTQGDFAIKNKQLFYKNQLIATENKQLLVSSEEVFFLFEISDAEVSKEFKNVVLLNFSWPKFFKCNGEIISLQRELQFVDTDGRTHAFRLVSYQSSTSTKVVGSNFQKY